jgi:hypothetical protein
MGKGSSMLCLKEDHFFENKRPLTVMDKRNKIKTASY